jgi:hypothetical protein
MESGGVTMPTSSAETERFVREDLQTGLDEDDVLDVWDPEEEDEDEEEEEETGEDRGWSD